MTSWRFLFFQPKLQGGNQADQESSVKEAKIGHNSIPSDVSPQRLLNFGHEHGLARTLTGIPAAETKDFLKEFLVSLLTARAHAEVVLNGAFDDRLVQVIRQFVPGGFIFLLGDGISPPL
jgi:hypothetical protein